MKKIRMITLMAIVILIIPCYYSYSQEIKANVVVNVEQLSFEARNYVASMADDLSRYINNQRFGDEDWKSDKIPVELNIYLSGGTKNRYSGRLFIVAQRNIQGGGLSTMLKMKDERWSFNYGTGATFTFSTLNFDEFRSLIDYYLLMIIGFDKDLYGELDGSRFFEKAKQVIQIGSAANAEGYQTQSQIGDFTRFNLINELTDMRYEDLRKLFFSYYYDGLDAMNTDKQKGIKALDDFVYNLAKFKKEKLVGPSVLLQLFFDTKGPEIASIFKGYEEKSVFQNLIYLDPSNTVLYQEAQESK